MGRPGWLRELDHLDRAAYQRIARARTPKLDRALRGLSRAADYSRLSLAAAACLAAGGPRGRRAAASGLASVAVTAAVVNAVIKPLARRSRPDRAGAAVPLGRRVRMPISRSFPSGHTAAAVAFATGAGRELPAAGPPLLGLATLVGYSRVHTGVHYPSDVIAGALCGVALAKATGRVLRPAARSSPEPGGALPPRPHHEPRSVARSGRASP
jgi:membrane-associated phospholipid phosphatase